MKDLINETAKLQTLIELYRSKAVSEFEKALVRAMEKISYQLLNFPSDFTRSKLNALKNDIANIILEAHKPLLDNLLDDNYYIANTAFSVYASSIADDFTKVPETAIKRLLDPNRHILGQTLKEITLNLSNKQQTDFKRIIADGIISGDSASQITRQLKEYNQGSLKSHLQAIVVTSFQSVMQEAYNEASKMFDDIISVVYSNGVLDSRTSVICQAQTGKYVKRKKDEPYSIFIARATKILIATPRHLRCRSKLLQETKETFEDRANNLKPSVDENGKVKFYPQNITYDEFFKDQSASFQKAVLGEQKYKLYKEGKFEVSQLRDVQGNRYLSNEEIEALL